MSTVAVELSESAACIPECGDSVTNECDPQQYNSNDGQNGSANETPSAAAAPVLDRQKLDSGSTTVCNRDNGTQTTSCNSDAATQQRGNKMTSSSTHLEEMRSDSKILMQIKVDKGAPNPQSSPRPSKSRRDQFCKVFPDIAETEEVIKSYHCAFVRDILLQGFLYITPNWFCFYSKLLGKKCIRIPVAVVTNITKKKTAIIIPNAIRVNTETNKYVFGSLMSRDNTYQIMFSVWQEKRKMLLTSIPLEAEKSDVNEDFETVASVSTNNSVSSLLVSAKEESVLSSDASFCSDLDSTSHSALCPRMQDRIPSASLPASQRRTTAPELAGEDANQTAFRYPLSAPSGSNVDRLSNSVQSKTRFTSITDLVTWIMNLPRTCLFLAISTILVLFLLLSAMLLAYKLVNLQMQLATYVGQSYHDDISVESRTYREVLQEAYIIRHDFHISNIEKIHMILESHVEILGKVNQVLKELRSLAASNCSPVSPGVKKS